MTSPSMVHRSGDTLVVRSVVSGNQLFVDDNEAERYSEDASEDIDYCDEFFDPDDNKNLPECKIRRNYSCVSCHFFTQNPRHYLYHLRDVHKEKVKIYECSNCLYASKHFQKLLRHTKMVHGSLDNSEGMDSVQRQKVRRKRKRPSDEDVVDPELSGEDMEGDEDDAHRIGDIAEDLVSSKSATYLKCSLCPFTTKHQGQLTKHEKQEHIKTKFFRCTKCSYVTHIKARFTKHVKYHSMPMIKCDLCDFRTPYKWNLDRHYKNHNGHGAFRCSACNFTADIKQSLTVHEMNHHVPPVGQAAGLGVGRRRNKVGASDTTAAEEAAAAAALTASVAVDPVAATVQHRDTTQGLMPEKQENLNDTHRKSPKIKISIKKVKSANTQEQNERHNFETDFIHPDDIIHHSNGNIYIKNKCKLCNYKTAWDTEMARHERKVHNIIRDNGQQKNVVVKKTPRPIPNLIPIQSSQPSQATSASSLLKIPHVQNRPASVHGQFLPKADEYLASTDNVMSQKDLNDMCAKSANSSLRDFTSLFGDDVVFGNDKSTAILAVAAADEPESKPVTVAPTFTPQPAAVPSSALFKKKNASFFDKLKEKLMTGESCNLTCKWCGHESKCLSESAGHQKTCGKQQSNASSLPTSATTTSSTRCQHCRQRCKSSIDLHNHLQVCSEANKHNDSFGYNFEKPDITIKLEDEHVPEDSLEPHPMENVVFVWNNISPQPPDIDEHNLSERLEDNSLDLSIRVQSPESEGSFMECENVSGNISGPAKMPTHGNNIDMVTEGRRVFKCPHCSFWATTASRFHVHIVGHLNKKPFECSLCAYRSNWRWDITKHIRLKSVRDPAHEKARVLMTDETGRRNYSKYNKYLTQLRPNDSPQENSAPGRRSKSNYDANQGNIFAEKPVMELPKLTRAPTNIDLQTVSGNNPLRPPPPLKAANEMYFQSFNEQKKRRTSSDSKKTLFKCKKCNFRDASRDNILLHVKGHYRQENNVPGNAETDEASVSRGQAPFRCGHCHQVSNWKHVIQRHCRLKHSGDVRVVIGGKNGTSDKIEIDDQTDEPDHMDVIQSGVFKCKQCPYSTNIQPDFDNHLEMHVPKNTSTIKCYFCPFYVAQKFELFDHLRLHGVSNPEDYVNRAMQGRELASPTEGLYKRYKCVMCPYVSNSKSQFLYHKQFHRHRGGPFKCDYCSYNVTRRHLLHQHLKVHGINIPHQKNSFRSGSDRESDAMDSEDFGLDEFEEVMSPSEMLISTPEEQIPAEVPLVWVSREGKFSKMYKCRYCPHVNLRKVNIQEHEKMHMQRNPNSPRTGDEHACNECSYVCNNAGVLSSHLKVHQSIYGQIHCLVDTEKTDDEQISELSRLLNVSSSDSNNYSADIVNNSTKLEETNGLDDQDKNLLDFSITDEHFDRMLYFCEHCPARFLHEKEYNIHIKFHGIRLFYRCDYCTYAARQRPHLLSHNKVHNNEYQEKTKLYQLEYPTSGDHPPPRTAVIVDAPGNNNGAIWVVISSVDRKPTFTENEISVIKTSEVANGRQSNKNFVCIKCPARFFKDELLQYHMTLHGCKNPYKCKFCDYAARTSSNLQKHVRIHEQQKLEFIPVKPMSTAPVVPLSGTDLFQQKSEAERQSTGSSQQDALPGIPMHIDPQFGTLVNGNPKFIYPTYLKNGRMKEKRYKCHKCPSAFEKREQYKVHLSLHGSKQRYKCENCDYSVKYYANYIQHIRKHQMNEDALAAKKSEIEDEDEEEVIWKDEPTSENIVSPPFSKLAIKTLNSSAKRGPLKLSVADRQTLMILQQRRTSSASSTKESTTEDKKLFWCPHCPYTNYRRDAVDNHVNRHICVSGIRSNYTCDHCDYTVPQSHFLREHVKIHFAGQKNHIPEGFMVCNNLQLLSSKCADETDNVNSDESVIFQDCGDSKSDQIRFKPVLESDLLAVNNNNNEKIYVNPENGEFLENSSGKSETKESKKSL